MLSPLNDGAKLYCEYSEILGVPDNLVRWRMRYSSIRMFYYSYLKNDGSLDVLYQFKCQFLSMYCSDPSCYFHIQLSKYSVYYLLHRANVLLNILGVQMLRYFISYITKFISIKEDGYPKISLTTTLFKNSIIPLQIIYYEDTCLKFSLLKN